VDRGAVGMTHENGSWTREVQVVNPLGIHARPAGKICQTAGRFTSQIFLETEAGAVDAKSILDILTLAAPRGTRVCIRAHGPDAQEAVEAVAQLFVDRFGEE